MTDIAIENEAGPRMIWIARLTRVLLGLSIVACAPVEVPAGPPLHPLVGRIWDLRAQQFISEAQLLGRMGPRDVVLLGETHDNPEHHAIQARLLARRIASGARPSLVMEQFDREHQHDIDLAVALAGANADTIADAGHFDRKAWGWPRYEPLVSLALGYRLDIVAANLSRGDARQIALKGRTALPAEAISAVDFFGSWSDWRQRRSEASLVDAHCGHAPREYLDGLVTAQRARDAVLAGRVLARARGGAVVVLGREHARLDIGAPIHLVGRIPGAVLSIALTEVDQRHLEPQAYFAVSDDADAAPQHDYLWFTLPASRPDPCEQFRRSRSWLSEDKRATRGGVRQDRQLGEPTKSS